jgi:plastocyanin
MGVMTRHRVPAALLAALSLTVVAACGDDDDDTASTEAVATDAPADAGDSEAPEVTEAPTATEPAGTAGPEGTEGDAQIVISGSSFGEPISVAAGTTVTVRNDDSFTHTWTSDEGVFDSGGLSQGDTFSFTFDEPGEFSFHCEIHTSMQSSVTVTG